MPSPLIDKVRLSIRDATDSSFGPGIPYGGAAHINSSSWASRLPPGWVQCRHSVDSGVTRAEDGLIVVDGFDEAPTLTVADKDVKVGERILVVNNDWARGARISELQKIVISPPMDLYTVAPPPLWGVLEFDDGYEAIPGDTGSVVVDPLTGEWVGVVYWEVNRFLTRETLKDLSYA